MVQIGNYTIMQYTDNKIVIGLPQTIKTITNTIAPVEDRKVELSNEELASLLLHTIKMFRGEKNDC